MPLLFRGVQGDCLQASLECFIPGHSLPSIAWSINVDGSVLKAINSRAERSAWVFEVICTQRKCISYKLESLLLWLCSCSRWRSCVVGHHWWWFWEKTMLPHASTLSWRGIVYSGRYILRVKMFSATHTPTFVQEGLGAKMISLHTCSWISTITGMQAWSSIYSCNSLVIACKHSMACSV